MARRSCKPSAAAGGTHHAIPGPPSRTFENLHRHCLAFVAFLLLTGSALALQPREPLQNAPLPQSLLDDITALADATSEYRITVKFVDAALARVQSGTLVSDAGWNLKPVAQLAQGYGAAFEQRLNAGACTNLNAMLAKAEQNTGVAQPDFEGFHELIFAQPIDGTQFLSAYDDLVARSEIEFVGINAAGMAPPPTATPDFSSGPPPSQTAYRGSNPGADFAFAHAQGLTGAGMRLSEVSLTYDLEHEEFRANPFDHDLPDPPRGFFQPAGSDFQELWNLWVNHGTATLGQNLAPDNGFGVTGMTYEAAGYLYQTGQPNSNDTGFDLRFEDAYCNALADSALAGNGQIVTRSASD